MSEIGNLVITRRVDESVRVTVGGEVILVTVVRIGGSNVRLAFEADRERVGIFREELIPVMGNKLPDPTDELVKACRALSDSKPATAPVGDKRENG